MVTTLLAACQCDKPGPAPITSPSIAKFQAPVVHTPVGADTITSTAKGLTDAQLDGFLKYKAALTGMMQPSLAIANDATRKGGTNPAKFDQAERQNPTTFNLAATYQNAIQSTGLTPVQLRDIANLTSQYYREIVLSGKAAKDPTKDPQKVSNDLAAFKEQFAVKYGESTVALLDKHWPDFKQEYDGMLKRMEPLSKPPGLAPPITPPPQ